MVPIVFRVFRIWGPLAIWGQNTSVRCASGLTLPLPFPPLEADVNDLSSFVAFQLCLL